MAYTPKMFSFQRQVIMRLYCQSHVVKVVRGDGTSIIRFPNLAEFLPKPAESLLHEKQYLISRLQSAMRI